MVRRQVKRLSTLDDAARFPTIASDDDDLDPGKGPGWLLDQASRRSTDRPLRLSAGQLIAFWQAQTLSNTVIQRVQEELEGRGLTVEPDLRGLEPTMAVEIRPAGGDTAGEPSKIGYCIGDIPSAREGLHCVNWNDPVTAMFDEMLRSKRDHVGVTDESGLLIGCADWITVCSEMQSSPETPAETVAGPALEVHASEKLFMLTKEIVRRRFVCVVDDTGAVTGAVNCADITAEHERRLLPLSLIEEIELRLRRRISGRVEVKYRRGRGKTFTKWKQPDQLTFGDYVSLIDEDETFRQMGWALPGFRLRKAVDRVRIIRNAVFHHRPGRPNEEDLSELEALLRTLEGFDRRAKRTPNDPEPPSE